MTSKIVKITLAGIALTAAACGIPLIGIYPQVLYQDHNTLYYPQAVSVFGGAGGPTEIYGGPAGGATGDEITANLRLPHFVASRTLKAVQPDGTNSGIRLVLIFNPQRTIIANDVCKGLGAGSSDADQMRVKGVFCRGSRAMSEALVFAEGTPRVSDPAFAATVNRLISSLMPPNDPNRDQEARPRRTGP